MSAIIVALWPVPYSPYPFGPVCPHGPDCRLELLKLACPGGRVMFEVADGDADNPKASWDDGNEVETLDDDRGRLIVDPFPRP